MPRRGVIMGRRYDAVFMDLLAAEFLQAGGSVLAGRAPHADSVGAQRHQH